MKKIKMGNVNIRFKSFQDVWQALDDGHEVFWVNELYHITKEFAMPHHCQDTIRNGLLLRVTCIDNYFGSLLLTEELAQLFIKDGKENK